MSSRFCAILGVALLFGGYFFLWGPGKVHVSSPRTDAGLASFAAAHAQRGIHGARSLPRLLDPDGDDDDATPICDLSLWQPDDDRVLAAVALSAPISLLAIATPGPQWSSGEGEFFAAPRLGPGNFLATPSLESLSVRLQV